MYHNQGITTKIETFFHLLINGASSMDACVNLQRIYNFVSIQNYIHDFDI
jgi:hypothetical protein